MRTENGKPTHCIPSLVERVALAYARQLIHQIPLLDSDARPLLDHLKTLSKNVDTASYIPYYRARLLQILGDTQDAIDVFLPFARQKSTESWVWECLSTLQTDGSDKAIACLVKAINLNKKEDFIVKIRQNLAKMLISKQLWDEARYEIEKLTETRLSHQWKMPYEVTEWTSRIEYNSAKKTTSCWYTHYLPIADSVLYSDLSYSVGIITDINVDKMSAQISIQADVCIWFSYKTFMSELKIGDVVRVQTIEKTHLDARKQQIVTASKTHDQMPSLRTKTVTSILKSAAGGIGFVEQVYIPKALIPSSDWIGRIVTVEAVESFDSVKKRIGWKAYSIR